MPSEVHSCLCHAITSKEEEVHVSLELRQNSDLSRHIKEPQNSIYCLNFFKKNTKFEVTGTVLFLRRVN